MLVDMFGTRDRSHSPESPYHLCTDMKVGKPKSKRVSVRLRHKIEKASASKQRKERKEAKKNPQWRSRLKKDPGIPNLFPYKAKILAEIEEARNKKVEEAQRRKDIAKAQRESTVVGSDSHAQVDDEDEELLDEDDEDDESNNDMEIEGDSSNPMAALLASAQARASAYTKDDDVATSGASADDEWNGIGATSTAAQPIPPTKKRLPPQALADPVKSVTVLVERMQQTQDGLQRLIDHYQVPAIATGNTDVTSRFLVEVARKRGRLSRGGIPNMHAAALVVLSDLNDERLVLPAPQPRKKISNASKAPGLGQVQVVSTMAEPFKLEGLWGDEKPQQHAGDADMVVDA
nr:gtpase grn1 [Quercus suber]